MVAFAHGLRFAALIGLAAGALAPAHAYLYWSKPTQAGARATGDDPTLVASLKGASPKELEANLIWTMRAGLNVAALQCQFAPSLRTVDNYNNMLHQHGVELAATYATLNGYFKRTVPKAAATMMDQYTTRTYNSFSTLNAQLSFCEVAASIGRETLERPKGQLAEIAAERLREFRSSLVPVGDPGFSASRPAFDVAAPADLAAACYDKKGRDIDCVTRKRIK
jgi:hypothetical protein